MFILDLIEKTVEKTASSVEGNVCGAVISRVGVQTAILINDNSILEIKGTESTEAGVASDHNPSSAEESDNEQTSESDNDDGAESADKSTDESDEGGNTSEGSIPDENLEYACNPCIIERGRLELHTMLIKVCVNYQGTVGLHQEN